MLSLYFSRQTINLSVKWNERKNEYLAKIYSVHKKNLQRNLIKNSVYAFFNESRWREIIIRRFCVYMWTCETFHLAIIDYLSVEWQKRYFSGLMLHPIKISKKLPNITQEVLLRIDCTLNITLLKKCVENLSKIFIRKDCWEALVIQDDGKLARLDSNSVYWTKPFSMALEQWWSVMHYMSVLRLQLFRRNMSKSSSILSDWNCTSRTYHRTNAMRNHV